MLHRAREPDVDVLVEAHHAERERGPEGHVGLRVKALRVDHRTPTRRSTRGSSRTRSRWPSSAIAPDLLEAEAEAMSAAPAHRLHARGLRRGASGFGSSGSSASALGRPRPRPPAPGRVSPEKPAAACARRACPGTRSARCASRSGRRRRRSRSRRACRASARRVLDVRVVHEHAGDLAARRARAGSAAPCGTRARGSRPRARRRCDPRAGAPSPGSCRGTARASMPTCVERLLPQRRARSCSSHESKRAPSRYARSSTSREAAIAAREDRPRARSPSASCVLSFDAAVRARRRRGASAACARPRRACPSRTTGTACAASARASRR